MTVLVIESSGIDGGTLLVAGIAIWCVNVLVFAALYWEIERTQPRLDFLFPQQEHRDDPAVVPSSWTPSFTDYLYLSYTNATAFSPTDVAPLSRWAKLVMMLQSLISLATVALVIAKAVNKLG